MENVKDVLGIAGGLFDRWQQYREAREDAAALVRLLYIECRRNLALLDALNLDGSQDDPDYVNVAQGLETAILEQVFMTGEKQTKALDKIRQQTASSSEEIPVNTTDALMRLYVKITTVQKISRLDADGKALKAIHYRTRLKNVKQQLLQIIPELESLARAS